MKVPSLSQSLGAFLIVLTLVPAARGDSKWPREFGAHRAVVHVDRYVPAVLAKIPWRQVKTKGAVVVDAASGKAVPNMVHIELTPEQGQIAFEPFTGPGDYYVYYRAPYPEDPKPDDAWRERNNLTQEQLSDSDGPWRKLPPARFIGFQDENSYEAFTCMERVASKAEIEKMLAKHSESPYLLFPEDRKNPIRRFDAIPEHWARLGPSDTFEGLASRNEFYTYQIGVYAARMTLEDLDITFGDLKSKSGAAIPASAMRCFNKGGVDWKGQHFTRVTLTEKEKVRPLWIGIQIPRDAKPGLYTGEVTVTVKGVGPSKLNMQLHVDDQVLEDSGDADLWRHARLRWLDSTIALDDEPTQPYTPVTVQGLTIGCLGRDLTLGEAGLPAMVNSYFAPANFTVTKQAKPLLAGPIELIVEDTGGQAKPFSGGATKVTSQTAARATWESNSEQGDLKLHCEGLMEFDGYAELKLAVTATKTTSLNDVRLVAPLRREAVPYMMGLGVKGGFRPGQHQWTWDAKKLQDSVWLGDVNGGMRFQLLDDKYERPLVGETFKALAMPASWQNEGRGGVRIAEEGEDRVVLRALSGARTIQAGQTLHFDVTLLITPFKTLDMPTHWASRYYQESAKYPTPEDAEKWGVNVVNVHQGNDLNPWINYPFLTVDAMKKYVQSMHAKNIKTKIYYTVRELSTRVVEMWALRSLDGEIFLGGTGGGGELFMQDHLVTGYTPAWTAVLPDGSLDTSISTNALSRWHNYYLEGLSWLMKNIEIDGLYLDGIGYNRDVFKRARKIMDRTRPGSLIDWHNGNEFQPKYGMTSPANQYMEFFPYVNRLWFGEMFDYGESPEFYLIELSGIPFGVMGEMINGNAQYGPVYGMNSRMGWSWGVNDPKSLWKMWDQFGIKDSEMLGYWNPKCPVKPDHPRVRATVYRKPGSALIAMANWADTPVQCRLAIDFKALGIDPGKARLRSIAVEGIQPDAIFKPTDAIPIGPGHSWQLILESAEQ